MFVSKILNSPLTRYLLLLLLIGIVYNLFLTEIDITQILEVGIYNFIILILLQIIFFYLGGCQYSYFIFLKASKKLGHLERLCLSSNMTFWSYIIPLQGSVLYLSTILRKRYDFPISMGIGFVIYILSLNLLCFGIFLLIFLIPNFNFELLMFSLFFISFPFYCYSGLRLGYRAGFVLLEVSLRW